MKKLLFFGFFALLLIGCAKKQIISGGGEVMGAAGGGQEKVPPQSIKEPSVRHSEWEALPQLAMVHFDFDKSELKPEDREILKKNADYLQGQSDITILVEGHCDEKGTVEYNLALGQRRATAVREYYGYLGIALNRIATISYGKEKPLDPGHDEAAWAKNRRAETKISKGGQ